MKNLNIEEIKKLLLQYRDEEMPNWNLPFDCDAEGWATIRHFIIWLENREH